MTILTDSSFIYALFNTHDSRHQRAMDFASRNDDEILIPDVILPEVSFLFFRDFGYIGVQRFLDKFQSVNAVFQAFQKTDLPRIHEISVTYTTAEFDIVDCCIMALAERLNITRIATFDRRDFSIFRPKHCEFFELLP